MQNKYVSVNAEADTDGVIRPLLIRWHDGRQWEVMTGVGDNDTSVIRGPATMKAGRFDSYGAVQHTAV